MRNKQLSREAQLQSSTPAGKQAPSVEIDPCFDAMRSGNQHWAEEAAQQPARSFHARSTVRGTRSEGQ